jgi:hypothetical protein
LSNYLLTCTYKSYERSSMNWWVTYSFFFFFLNKLHKFNQTIYLLLVLKPYSSISFWFFFRRQKLIFIDIYIYSYSIYYLNKFFYLLITFLLCINIHDENISELMKHDKHSVCQSFLRACVFDLNRKRNMLVTINHVLSMTLLFSSD